MSCFRPCPVHIPINCAANQCISMEKVKPFLTLGHSLCSVDLTCFRNASRLSTWLTNLLYTHIPPLFDASEGQQMRSMGRLGYDPVVQHFSHPHPLELSSFQHSLAPISCAGCTLRAPGWAYSCKTCGYHLHISCYQMPPLIRHPADPHHALRLLTVPAYPEGSFNCDACGRPGTGFSYHCSACGLDVHTLCASMPLSVNHDAHTHPLSLSFFPSFTARLIKLECYLTYIYHTTK